MKPLSRSARSVFKQWGQEGGRKRARLLSKERRSTIAAKAARIRWKGGKASSLEQSVRLQAAYWDDPVFLEEALSEGGLQTWQELYCRITKEPGGSIARALEKVLTHCPIYGVTPLWRGLLEGVRCR